MDFSFLLLPLSPRLVEDADLWKWAIQDSQEFHSGMIGLGLEFDINKNPKIFDTLQVMHTSFTCLLMLKSLFQTISVPFAPNAQFMAVSETFSLPAMHVPQSLSISDLVESGRCLRAEEDRCISDAVGSAFRVQLGGEQGRAKGWGVCLAVEVEEGMEKLRSRMGNELALESRSQGLQVLI